MTDSPQVDACHIAVTGATGFIGAHLARALAARGDAVRALARSHSRAAMLPPRVQAIIGDVTAPDTLPPLLAGCSAVVHLVSDFRTAGNPPARSWAINVDGTRRMLQAARAAGVRRFVYGSTIGVHGHVRETPAAEDAAYAPGDTYQETKVAAERLCREEMARGGMEIVIARPASVYGPGDLRMLKMFRMLARRTFLQAGPARENFHAVYIDDLVAGLLLLLDTPGIDGETFILGGPAYLPLADYIATAAASVGAPPPWLRVPYRPLLALSAATEALCRPFGIDPPLHRRRVRFFRNNRAFDISKARARLGYAPHVGLEEGMGRTVAWYRQEGLLR